MGFLSIDPGVRCMAIAQWDSEGHLFKAWNEQTPNPDYTVDQCIKHWSGYRTVLTTDEFVGEKPVVYPGAKGLKTDPNDLVNVALCAAAFYSVLLDYPGTVFSLVEPAEWKAQVPKEITRERIKAILTPQEISRIRKGGEMHNVWDAIGIGLFASGRAKRGMVR